MAATAFAPLEHVQSPKKTNWLRVVTIVSALVAAGGGATYALKHGFFETPAPAVSPETAFAEAIAVGTAEALDQFAAKYPTSPLAKAALREKERIAQAKAEVAKHEPAQLLVKPGSAPIVACDRLAANRDDPDRIPGADGVDFDNIDTEHAVSACAEAVQKYPGERRFAFTSSAGRCRRRRATSRRASSSQSPLGRAAPPLPMRSA
jgi:hypothetical protein